MSTPSQQAFKDAMAHVVASVFLVTTDGPAGKAGFTATSVTSVSNTPPSLLVCANRSGPSLAVIERNSCFALSLLDANSTDLANRFAGRHGVEGDARFEGSAWQTAETGAPLLVGAATTFDCKLAQATLYGSHMILIGDALHVSKQNGATALLYGHRHFGTFKNEAG